MANFIPAYNRTKKYEGGWANVPGDKGGKTYMGIASAYHPNWRGWNLLKKYQPLKHNQIVPDAELEQAVQEFYKTRFWGLIQGDNINDQKVAELLYDYTVHSGNRGVKAVQKILGGLVADGVMGAKTIAAINAVKPEYLFNSLKAERLAFLTSLSQQAGQQQFKNGWLNRVGSFIY